MHLYSNNLYISCLIKVKLPHGCQRHPKNWRTLLGSLLFARNIIAPYLQPWLISWITFRRQFSGINPCHLWPIQWVCTYACILNCKQTADMHSKTLQTLATNCHDRFQLVAKITLCKKNDCLSSDFANFGP